MIRYLWFAVPLCITVASPATASNLSTFQDITVPAVGDLNDAGPSGFFVSGGNSFNNSYDPTYGGWSGWSISNNTNTTTPGYSNQYSAITGSGVNGSSNYAVAYTYGDNTDSFHPSSSFINLAAGTDPTSIDVTNTTYADLSMANGDQFAKKFRAGDFFELTITGYSGANGTGSTVGNTIDFYLANFLGGNAYIVNTWNTIDLSSLAGSSSLVFGLMSSDNDPTYGMNTPAYFAADDFLASSAVPEPASIALLVTGIVGLACPRRGRRILRSALSRPVQTTRAAGAARPAYA